VPDQAAATGQAAAMALELELEAGSDQGWDPAQLLGLAQGWGQGLGLLPALLLQLVLLVLL